MNILLIDNYDSFTYNLVHYLEGFDCTVTVVRNDELNNVNYDDFDKIVISPGPGLPKESNQLMSEIPNFINSKPVLGVCLGFQAIIEHFGGSIHNQNEVKHGVQESCFVSQSERLLQDIPAEFKIGLYHSWAASEEEIPHDLMVTSKSKSGIVMSFEHKTLPICGVQFHPESILTENGLKIVENFLKNFK